MSIFLRTFLEKSAKSLEEIGIKQGSVDAYHLIRSALDMSPDYSSDSSYFLQNIELTSEQVALAQSLIDRRLKREPIGRILDSQEFGALTFRLNEATFLPVARSYSFVRKVADCCDRTKAYRILDLGTGSGCLLITLLDLLPNATGLGIDVVPEAVRMAHMNARWLNYTDRASFQVGDWFDGVGETFDLIVCNPPKVATEDIAKLEPQSRDYNPHIALDGGKDGYAAYRHVIAQAPHFLKPYGTIGLQIEDRHIKTVRDLLKEKFTYIEVYKDSDKICCVVAKLKKSN